MSLRLFSKLFSLARKPDTRKLRIDFLEDRTNPAAFAGWEDLSAIPARPASETAYLHPDHYRPLHININDLRSSLTDSPNELALFVGAAPVVVTLPAPDGSLQRFSVTDSSVMDPELAAQFPDIQTFQGFGLDDPSANLRMDITPQGFHAQVLSTKGSWYIDPYFHQEDDVAISYYASDLTGADVYPSNAPGSNSSPRQAPVLNAPLDPIVGEGPPTAARGGTPAARSSGTQLRTYRLAVAATGEYTAFHGGTVAKGQAAIVTAVNRVSGVYESELSIRLVLVANNSSLVYTNAASDPYTNSDAFSLLDENQTNIDSIIGSANYDIGHVFSTGGGGLAGLGVVGQTGQKAQGETGSSSPIADAYYIDYVAHEMGHQFGANHSFNTSSDSNRNAATAYEPGSGSTIMAYAGITGLNSDLQSHSDPFFNTGSFDEIINFVDTTIPNVGVRTATGNFVPTVSAGSNYVIPASTPFVLTATGSDANGDALTYSWEERDLGAANLLTTADNGTSPLFRVYNPTTNPSRTFPRLSDLISNINTIPLGEKLPTVNRAAMKFRVTARDNRAGGGGVNTSDMQVQVVATGAAFAVTSPNTAVTWNNGQTQSVTWNVAGTTGNGINAANVNITLSTDGGLTYPITLASNVPNNGSANITVPSVSTTQARVRVQGAGNIFFDISNANFSIVVTTPVATISPVTPNPRDIPVDSMSVVFNKAVTGFDIPDLKLLRDGVNVPLTAATLTTSDNITWTLGNLSGLTGTGGQYQLTLTAAGSGIIDSVGNAIAANAVGSWTNTSTVTSASFNAVTPNPRNTPVDAMTVVFNKAVTGFDLSDLELLHDSVSVPLTGVTLTSADNITWMIGNLSGLTGQYGEYVMTLTAAGSNIVDSPGNALTSDADVTWDNNTSPTMNTTPLIVFPAIAANAANPPGAPISLLTANITDPDPGALKGIAITAVAGTGAWQYSSDNGGSWSPLPTVSSPQAFLLGDDANTRLRFKPAAKFNGFASIKYRAWDQTSGTSGDLAAPAGPAFGSETETAWQAVGATSFKSDASGNLLLTPVKEDTKISKVFQVKNILGYAGLEAAPKTNLGIALTSAPSTDGVWQYNLTTLASGWDNVPIVAANDALLLRPTDSLRFLPNPNADGQSLLTFKLWDQSTIKGAGQLTTDPNGAAYPGQGAALMDITAVNDAPVLNISAPAILNPVDAGETTNTATFASMISATDVEGAPVGVAVTASTGTGTWMYRVPGGSWTLLPKIAAGKALPLPADTEVNFSALLTAKPQTASLSFRAWDGTKGAANVLTAASGTAFSVATKRITVAVGNAQPILTDTAPHLTTIKATAKPGSGSLVSALLSKAVQDTKGSLTGIAVVAADTANGTWQYLTTGTVWKDFGTLSEDKAVLLSSANRVRFVPNPGISSPVNATLTYKAWDRTAGDAGDRGVDTSVVTGTLNSFSDVSVSATISVTL